MKKKIYIAGKVSGLPKQEVIDKFSEVQTNLERCGFKVINPIEVVNDFDVTWEFAMKKCIKALVDCDAVYLMNCHGRSVGAMLEFSLAMKLKIPCVDNIFKLGDLWNN